MKIANIVGARPQFIKAAAVCAAARKVAGLEDVLIHTGQHYDADMSEIFFDQLAMPKPDVELGIGSGSHGEQTGQMMMALEGVISDLRPDLVLVYGDTNTTLAGAVTASKLRIPLAHVEAGLRSHNRSMPEEINRVVTDRVSSILFCPTPSALENLAREGIEGDPVMVGDVMADILMASVTRARMAVLGDLGLRVGSYYLMTLHRAANTDDPLRLRRILDGASQLPHPVVFPVHPRTKAAIGRAGIEAAGSLRLISPVGYLESLALQMHSRAILTDSGGMQKEAYMLGVPCVTLREETEWPETVEAGWNRLVADDPVALLRAVGYMPPDERPDLYGDGHTAERIVERIVRGAGSPDKGLSKNGSTPRRPPMRKTTPPRAAIRKTAQRKKTAQPKKTRTKAIRKDAPKPAAARTMSRTKVAAAKTSTRKKPPAVKTSTRKKAPAAGRSSRGRTR